MYIRDRSKTELDQAKIKLTGHFDRRHFGRYFEPCKLEPKAKVLKLINRSICRVILNIHLV